MGGSRVYSAVHTTATAARLLCSVGTGIPWLLIRDSMATDLKEPSCFLSAKADTRLSDGIRRSLMTKMVVVPVDKVIVYR